MKGKFCYKEHKLGVDVTLAICDAVLLGKVLKFNDVDFEVCEDFYGKNVTDSGHILELIERAKMINAIGKETIELLKKNRLVRKESVLMIDGIPHVQIINS